MALDSFRLIVIETLISQVIASYPYIQYAGAPYPTAAYFTSYPAHNYVPSTAPVYPQMYSQPAQNLQPPPNMQPYKNPTTATGIPASYTQASPSFTPPPAPTAASSTNPAVSPIYKPTAYQAAPYQQPIKAISVTPPPTLAPPKVEPIKPPPYIPTEITPKPNPLPKDLLSGAVPTFDSNILNNLAIALQLLIVSNLIHNPPPESHSGVKEIDEEVVPAVAPLPIAFVPPSSSEPSSHSHHTFPNANFIGSSSFGDTGISKSMMSAYGAPTLPAPRPMGLMSPYDAIGPNSPYAASFNSKPEPKSPYHLSSDYNDLFSLTELFKI